MRPDMLFWTIVKVGIKSLWANKLRSFLAMLGIIIGVGAVITMLAMGAGARKQILDVFSAMGTNLLIVRPGQSGFRGVATGTVQTLTLADAQAIPGEIPGVLRVAPAVTRAAQVKHLNKNSRTSIVGTSPAYLPIRGFEVERGRSFTEADVEHLGRVALLGPVTADNLFLVEDPVGQNVKIDRMSFKVVGVLKSKGDQGFYNPDDQVFVPYSTAMKQLFGLEFVQEIDIQSEEGADLSKVQAEVTALLRKRHRLRDDADDDFRVQNQAEILQRVSDTSRIITLLLAGIASISLLVGGIGIMNIMLVTVTERTREIGIRKAIGAKERSILLQFLLEAVTISGLGGILGVALGAGGAKIIEKAFTFTTIVELRSIVVSLSFAALVGIFFGWYPAKRASRLDPVEALRYE